MKGFGSKNAQWHTFSLEYLAVLTSDNCLRLLSQQEAFSWDVGLSGRMSSNKSFFVALPQQHQKKTII